MQRRFVHCTATDMDIGAEAQQCFDDSRLRGFNGDMECSVILLQKPIVK